MAMLLKLFLFVLIEKNVSPELLPNNAMVYNGYNFVGEKQFHAF